MEELETPSGKGAGDENFPVASWLLAAAYRPHVMAFYHVVRAADDIADNPDLTPTEKLKRLEMVELALRGDDGLLKSLPKVAALREGLDRAGVTNVHALDLLQAFKQDATKTRYDDWADLLGYCTLSASPVGRFLLDLHCENKDHYRFSDPLCDALQILNHLQDCGDDFCALDRLYLPMDVMRQAGVEPSSLAAPRASPALRSVLDHCLDGTDALLDQAAALPAVLTSRRLGAESAVILEMARELSKLLRRRDPLAERVQLSKSSFVLTALKGIGRLQWLRRGAGKASSSAAKVPQ